MITKIKSEFDFCYSCRLYRQTHQDADGEHRCLTCSNMRYRVDENLIVNSKDKWWVISFDGRASIHVQHKCDTIEEAIKFVGTDDALAFVP